MEPLLHFTIPFIALTLLGVKLKRSILLASLGLTPDLDALLHVHRSLSHSVLFYLALLLPPILYAWHTKRGWTADMVLALLVLLSHILMDVFSGYTPILWPLSKTSYWIRAGINGQISESISLTTDLEVLGAPTNFNRFHSMDYPLFTGHGAVTTLILILPVLVNHLRTTYGGNSNE